MSIISKFRTVFRGDLPISDLPREALRRKRAAARRETERRDRSEINEKPARLAARFASMTPGELLTHFRERVMSFFPFDDAKGVDSVPKLQTELFPDETATLIESADGIVRDSKWKLAGFGPLEFAGENVWRRCPLSGKDWGLEYHEDVIVYQADRSDIRVLWELNRFGHAITLARAFAVTNGEAYAETFFSHIESWMRQNPYACGANWNCAMEVALRSINLLAAFDIFRRSKACNEERLTEILRLFDQHGRFILDNNEFSYIATSNHYLSDVCGLFWIGTFLPELENSAEWREFGLREMLSEIDKQILPDGADFEASTGYHKFVTELLLYSFLLADRNSIEIDRKYWAKLSQMLSYIHGIMRPDGRVPLIGDADGSQVVPVLRRDADDQAYLLGIAAVVFNRPEFKTAASLEPEVLWIMGEKGVKVHGHLAINKVSAASAAFPDAGAYVMRDGDLYLHFNANDCGVNGRGSHGHNDALSIEVSAYGRAFIVDPGNYVYNLDRSKRQLFRSTAYHSTVMVDGTEQNTIQEEMPFVMGNEARPKVLLWTTGPERDRISVEHSGYSRLPNPIRHRRTVEFEKIDKYWLIEDEIDGKGEHEFSFSFHLAPGLTIDEIDAAMLRIGDNRGPHLLIRATGIGGIREIVPASTSLSYGHRQDSQILRWRFRRVAPFKANFLLVPAAGSESLETRFALLERLTQYIDS